MSDDLSLRELMQRVKSQFSYSELCKLTAEQETHYNELLNNLKKVNSSSSNTKEKGDALEDLVCYLLQISGGIFKIIKNVGTSSNEIDQVIMLNEKGRALLANGLVSSRLRNFLGECKNYNKRVNVTYVGKFYSLLQTTSITTGILFSYHGITGTKWSNASGLVKKIYLQRECESNRVAIINFDITDFISISKGENFLQIIDDKLRALQLDTTVDAFISAHPAEKLLSHR